jgi:hypothetical protein
MIRLKNGGKKMVNLKKIGAIATSALFLGATGGIAAASSHVSSSMLYTSGGEANAVIAYGTSNPDSSG